MPSIPDSFSTLRSFQYGSGRSGSFFSLPALEAAGFERISRLPVSLRIVLESVLRNCDGQRISREDVEALARWEPEAERTREIPFVVARIVLQDFTGVPLLVDLAAMRSAVARLGKSPDLIEPLVPVDLVIDHSVQVDFSSVPDAFERNMDMEFRRNGARYQFLKWGMQAFQGFRVIPPGIGIVHQVNLEYLAQVVSAAGDLWYPDTLVGTDSHTTMINGLGIVGWGVGGIEAEAGMLGQPVYFLMPDVVGVHLKGSLPPGVTATDLVLRITQVLRAANVVGRFVEYFGDGARGLSLTDRATISNMAPEYGATIGFFPVDEETCRYLAATGRAPEQVDAVRRYFMAQELFGIPDAGEIDYSRIVEIDLDSIRPSVAGPRRPQDRLGLDELKSAFQDLLCRPRTEGGYGQSDFLDRSGLVVLTGRSAPQTVSGGGRQEADPLLEAPAANTTALGPEASELEMVQNRPSPDRVESPPAGEFPMARVELGHGDVVIAAITSCTNTSNPSVMLAAGLLAKKAVERGLSVSPAVKTSLAPGSRVVTEYLARTGLQPYLDQLGFHLVGYGCTTCIGNSGPLDPSIEEAITSHDLVVASVLSGNRNFEARVHQNVRANFLMSPPLVVAFALAGSVEKDLNQEPLGTDRHGKPVYLREIWPSAEEINQVLHAANDSETYRRLYRDLAEQNPMWTQVSAPEGALYDWDPNSTYIQEPPFFDRFGLEPDPPRNITGARALAILGDSVTTDHISPAGAIKPDSPAGRYLIDHDVTPQDFNSYGSRRGNDRVMTRGTFANVRIRNLMTPQTEGGVTIHQPTGEQMSIYDAAMRYRDAGVPLIVLAGSEYGTGSSRDWAAKGAALLGVRAVVARSFERIHRSNLIGMGVLPLQFREGMDAASLGITGAELFEISGAGDRLAPRGEVDLVIRCGEEERRVPLLVRIDTPIELQYYRHGGILAYVLRQLIRQTEDPAPTG